MKTALVIGALALVLPSLAVAAQNQAAIAPNQLTEAAKRPPLQLTDQQLSAIQGVVARADTQQKTPKGFTARVGEKIPLSMTVDVLPPDVVAREPSLEPFGYAKLAKEVLVIDPLKKTIIAVLPRPDPSTLKDPTPVEWARTR